MTHLIHPPQDPAELLLDTSTSTSTDTDTDAVATDVGAPRRGRVLIAGVGNIFLSDDGFGVEVVRRLSGHELPAHVDLAETGVRGVDLAYRLLDGYEACILVDACARGGQPGTLYRIDTGEARAEFGAPPAFDGHRMTPDAVLGLLDTLSAGTGERPPHTIEIVGCEPAALEEGIGLSEAVEAAVPRAVQLILRIIQSDGVQTTAAHAAAVPETAAHATGIDTPGSAHPAPAPIEMGVH